MQPPPPPLPQRAHSASPPLGAGRAAATISSQRERTLLNYSQCIAKTMFSALYGKTAAGLYAAAAAQNASARQYFNQSADTYYKANDAASYDDWVRARNHWDYFYNRS